MIIKGDSLEELKKLQDNSIDAIVTDAPYGLSFMGKKWDYDVPSVELWKECLRVLKPGGYLLSFAGTRTQHRMAVRIEDAGFEIRDMIAWVYGSGFPKSLNIGKAVDKLQGNERAVVGEKMGGTPQTGLYEAGLGVNEGKYIKETKGTSEWEGWGTALKPALEPITVARKPIEGTVAENCLKWGVGGINIDGCRVETEETLGRDNNARTDGTSYVVQKQDLYIDNSKGLGRFPANLIHDGSEEVLELFPETTKGTARTGRVGGQNGLYENGHDPDFIGTWYGDPGSAARFFQKCEFTEEETAQRFLYQAKASKSERNMGLDGFEEKQYQTDGRKAITNMPALRVDSKAQNFHPTVKPIKLMEYLVKLVSKEGHTVLDPFAGSGTTGIACKKLGRNFIGIEREEDYVKIAEARIKAYEDK